MLVELKASMVEVIGDSQLGLKQLSDMCPETRTMKLMKWPRLLQVCEFLKVIDVTQIDWRFPIIQYLKDQSNKVSRKTKMQALNYVLIEDVLYRRGHDELLLRCLGPDESFQMLFDVHDGICGAHQAGSRCAVLPMELTVRSLRIVIQHNLQYGEYDEAMMLELEDLKDTRLTALDRLQAQKLKLAKSYNKRVKGKNLAVGDLV
ncbi:hypothetical protein SLEP1_g1385 [Rubroshorea leprosula]|uniref:Uncharacterized protein n=1 Tax=Rubroshorea leprosula TaxID=152421 RepID=A0AAV5HPH7_9ROSI|nr:hypothetical protein SLEP1_g1385 [Rubroshorea leprosula]